ncbi:hypothetical protein BC827DRAFT_23280 [Russula dissimulans]|nr:hypothetical protein BC827DRAFT_23280 [Russula dissimulans]
MRYSLMLGESSFANRKADYFWLLFISSHAPGTIPLLPPLPSLTTAGPESSLLCEGRYAGVDHHRGGPRWQSRCKSGMHGRTYGRKSEDPRRELSRDSHFHHLRQRYSPSGRLICHFMMFKWDC